MFYYFNLKQTVPKIIWQLLFCSVYTGEWVYFSPCAGLHISPCWTLWIESSLSLQPVKQVLALYGSTTPCCISSLSSLLSMKLLGVHSMPMSRSLMKSFYSIGPSIDTWGIRPVTSLQMNRSPQITMLWTWLFYMFSNRITDYLSKPYFVKFLMRRLSTSMSKALLKLR